MSVRSFLYALTAATFLAAPALAAEPVKVGLGIAETGPLAPAAIPQLDAYKMWVDEVNASGGLDVAGTKRPIQLIVYDDQSNFSNEPSIYEKLITDDNVDLLLSPWGTPAHFAVVGVLQRYGFPMVGSSAASSQLKQLNAGNIWFPTSAMPDAMAPQLVQLMKAQGVKTVAIATAQTPFSQEMQKYLVPLMAPAGITIVDNEQYPPNVMDLTSLVAKIAAEKPDAVLNLDLPSDGVLFLKAAREQNLSAPFQFMLLGPTEAFFTSMFGSNLDGIVTIGHWTPYQSKWPKAMPFYNDYVSRFHQAPDYLDDALAWMSCEILQQAVAKVGLDHDKLRQEISTDTFDTIDGPVKFNGVENVSTPVMFLQIQAGKPQIVWPDSTATAKFEAKPGWN